MSARTARVLWAMVAPLLVLDAILSGYAFGLLILGGW